MTDYDALRAEVDRLQARLAEAEVILNYIIDVDGNRKTFSLAVKYFDKKRAVESAGEKP